MKKILIVEDEKDILETILDSLEIEYEQGELKIVTASNAEIAIDLLTEHENFDLVVTDLNMPKCDGTQLIKMMRQKEYDSKCIVFTGHGSLEDTSGLNDLGISSIVNKPYVDKLLDQIKIALD